MAQIPHGEEHLVCPMHRCACSEVCHKCPWWVQVRGTNPNTGEEVDRWSCSMALLPMLTIEVAQQARQGGAATESLRNELCSRIDRPRQQIGHPIRQIENQ